jgi:sulfofructose kinase
LSEDGPEVVGLGYCVFDILAVVRELPGFDDVRMAHLPDLAYDGGGMVGTALAALARLGVRTGYIGCLGEDREGLWLREQFLREGVGVSRLRMGHGAGTNVCLILVEEGTGKRAILCHQRVSSHDLVLDELDRAYVEPARVLHLDGQFMPAALQAARWAHDAGLKVCYDGNHPRPGLEELLPLVNWLVVAESFPSELTGEDNLPLAARMLLAQGPEIVVVTLGDRGCRAFTANGQFHSPGFAVRAVDTTGAGDAFHGAFLYAMLQGWDLERVARFSNAAAALNCLRLGGRQGLPTLEQVQTFLPGNDG